MSAIGIAVLAFMAGIVAGLAWGRKVWGPRWFDTSEGIDRKFRKLRP